jgi:hypothetical protein
VANLIYLTYNKDDSIFTRIFDPTDELTWSYLRNTAINASTITFNNNPQSLLSFSGVDANFANYLIENYFPFLSYTLVNPVYALKTTSDNVYTRLLRPSFEDWGSNNVDISNVVLEVYNWTGSAWVYETEYSLSPYPYNQNSMPEIWITNPATSGLKQMLIRFNTFYFRRYGGTEQILRLPYDSNYLSQPIEEAFNSGQDFVYTEGSQVNVKLIEPFRDATQTVHRLYARFDAGSSNFSVQQYDSIFNFQGDTFTDEGYDSGNSSQSFQNYESNYDLESDTFTGVGFDSGSSTWTLISV